MVRADIAAVMVMDPEGAAADRKVREDAVRGKVARRGASTVPRVVAQVNGEARADSVEATGISATCSPREPIVGVTVVTASTDPAGSWAKSPARIPRRTDLSQPERRSSKTAALRATRLGGFQVTPSKEILHVRSE